MLKSTSAASAEMTHAPGSVVTARLTRKVMPRSDVLQEALRRLLDFVWSSRSRMVAWTHVSPAQLDIGRVISSLRVFSVGSGWCGDSLESAEVLVLLVGVLAVVVFSG